MRNYILSIISIALSFIVTASHAEQVKWASDNKTVFLKASATELTHIYVEGDKISQVRGIDGAYQLKQEATDGSIFVQPTFGYQDKSFTLFLTTQGGHTYPLLLTTAKIPAESIRLKPLTPSKKAASRWEQESAYEKTLLRLITALQNGKTPEGYIRVNENKEKNVRVSFTLQLIASLKGDKLVGNVYKITNTEKYPVTLDERQFYTQDTRAISLDNLALAPFSEGLLYTVVSND
ncbi:MAG: hypothetical protein LEGION0398_MBIBDBAK_00177 [Legionellaceae bacterium]